VKEPHGQGRASHPGPESCGEARKGVAEALTVGSAGERSSREITTSTAPTLLGEAEDNTGGDAITSAGERGRSRSSSACTDTPHAGTGGSHDPAGEDEGPERDEKAKGRTASMAGWGKSDSPLLPEKRSTKVGGPALCAAEGVEGRGLAKGNSGEQNALRTQSREQGALSALEPVREGATRDKRARSEGHALLARRALRGHDPRQEPDVVVAPSRSLRGAAPKSCPYRDRLGVDSRKSEFEIGRHSVDIRFMRWVSKSSLAGCPNLRAGEFL
jgi:hypothetical protein